MRVETDHEETHVEGVYPTPIVIEGVHQVHGWTMQSRNQTPR